jgi:hypothetical protein
LTKKTPFSSACYHDEQRDIKSWLGDTAFPETIAWAEKERQVNYVFSV